MALIKSLGSAFIVLNLMFKELMLSMVNLMFEFNLMFKLSIVSLLLLVKLVNFKVIPDKVHARLIIAIKHTFSAKNG